MEIGKEKVVIVPVSTLGLLMAMTGDADWETESAKKVVAGIVGLIDDVGTKNELTAYVTAFESLEMQACGEDAESLIDSIREAFGDEMLKMVLQKIEEIGKIRNRRKKK